MTLINKTLDFSDLRHPDIRPTVASINRWVWRWLLRGERLGVNGAVKRRAYIRPHKMWEYARGLALTKRLLNQSYDNTLEQQLEAEAFAQETAGLTEDHYEGVVAFIEKRKPDFKGK